ncbi:MAG: hypothetical protein OEW12_06615, partial [Deltaproteobacteria bacterium]|nr:hypothetical protein [Deltaproteobacteria bacterium]
IGVPLVIWLVQSFGVTVGGHYAAVAYPTGAVVLAAWLHRLPDGFDWTSPTRKIALVLCVAGMAAINIPLAVMVIHPRVLPDKYMVMERGNPRQPIGANYYGWREAGRHIAQLNAAWNRGQGFFLSTSDYSIASMLGFYTPGRPEFLLLDYGPKEFHGREFLLWGQGKKTMGANTLYVADHPKMAGYIKPFFQDTRALPPLEIRDAKGRVLRIFYFTLGFGYKDNEPQVLWAW